MARVRSDCECGDWRGLVAELAELLARWRDDLVGWAIPEHITASVTDSPWVLPRQVFARRADRLSSTPGGPSFQCAWAALDPPGTVLDVGAGAGAASLPLARRITALTAVDTDAEMLRLLAQRADELGLQASLVTGAWPDIAYRVPVADVVTCHHVLYNVSELRQFVQALTTHARRRVVVELTVTHPLTTLNELWQRFHGLKRPDGPTADQVLAILAAIGYRTGQERWARLGGADYASFAELVDVTRRRLCLPPGRAGEVADALLACGADPENPMDLGSSGREVVTVWWDGEAR
jgi:SAM-dependent methyltransferase